MASSTTSSSAEAANDCLGRLGDLIASSPSNSKCVDCEAPNPEWTSQGFGTFVCLNCAGYHRSIGAHVTTVRSITLDEWTPEQVHILEEGGNDRFWNYLRESKLQQKYHLPLVVYYSELLKARVQGREPKEFRLEDWNKLVRPATDAEERGSPGTVMSPGHGTGSSAEASPVSGKPAPVRWTEDSVTKYCMVCCAHFSLINRKHHCRRCGKVVCGACAPAENTRPIMEWGMREPVRHCKKCYRSPNIEWKD